jgi:hypothetical protein
MCLPEKEACSRATLDNSYTGFEEELELNVR